MSNYLLDLGVEGVEERRTIENGGRLESVVFWCFIEHHTMDLREGAEGGMR